MAEVEEVAKVAEVEEVAEVDFTAVVQEMEIAVDKFSPIFQWRDLVDLVVVVVGPSHLLGMGEVVAEVTPVEVVERIPVVVGEDLIMSINEITCVAGHLLVMVW